MSQHFETLQLHAGQVIDSSRSRAVPIHQTTSFVFTDSQSGADLFGLKAEGRECAGALLSAYDQVSRHDADERHLLADP